jgi:hypothetical protein
MVGLTIRLIAYKATAKYIKNVIIWLWINSI